MCGDFRIAGRAGGEEHNRRVVLARGNTLERVGERGHFRIKAVPARTVAVGHDFDLQRRTGSLRTVDLGGAVTVAGTDDGLDLCGVKAVFIVVLNK